MRPLPLMLLLVALAGCGADDDKGAASSPRESPRTQATAPSTDRAAERTPSADPADATDPKRAPLRLAVLGDSYSNGEAVGIERAWPTVMARQLTREGLATDVVANPSVTGATTSEMLDTALGPIRAARPDVMTVMLGVNDQVQGHTTEAFAADEDRALAAAVEITGSPRNVVAVDIPDYSGSPAGAQFGDPSATAKKIDAFNAVVRAAAARHGVRLVSIVDISRRLGSGGISDDGLHPDAEQLAEWAARIAPVARSRWTALPQS